MAGDAVEQAQTSAQGLAPPLVTNIPDTLTNQQNLVALFDSLMQKLGLWLKVGDEVAKV